eukprot:gene13490-biopygen1999
MSVPVPARFKEDVYSDGVFTRQPSVHPDAGADRTSTGRGPRDITQRNGRGPEADRTRALPFLPVYSGFRIPLPYGQPPGREIELHGRCTWRRSLRRGLTRAARPGAGAPCKDITPSTINCRKAVPPFLCAQTPCLPGGN